MVVSLGSQRDTEMLCAITASVQAGCVRTRGVEMLVSSEVKAVQPTNGREARRQRMPRPAEVVGIDREAAKSSAPTFIFLWREARLVCRKNGNETLVILVEEQPLALFLQACG